MVETDYIFTRVVEDGQGLQLICQSLNAGVSDLVGLIQNEVKDHRSRAIANLKETFNDLISWGVQLFKTASVESCRFC